MTLCEYLSVVGIFSTLVSLVVVYNIRRRSKAQLNSKNSEIEELIEQREHNKELTDLLAQGDFETNVEVGRNNIIGDALLEMRKSFKHVAKEEEQRAWASNGLNLFSEILRNTDKGLEELFDIILAQLVPYLDANQARVYYVNDDDENDIHLQLKACYAWEKKKYVNQRLEIKESLAGRCYREADSIFMTDVPDGYIYITSGIGKANPTSIFVAPIKLEDQVYGIIEFASFQVFETYQKEFIEKLMQNVASVIVNTKHVSHTDAMIKEMQAAKDKALYVQEEMNAQLEVLNTVISISKTDLDGNIIYVNSKMEQNIGYTSDELLGKNHRILKSDKVSAETYEVMWETITSGEVWRGEICNRAKNGELKHLDAIIAPLKNSEDEIIEYMAIRFPIDEKKQREQEMKQMLIKLEGEKKRTEAILEGAIDGIMVVKQNGVIEYANKAAEELMAAEKGNLLDKSISNLIPVALTQTNGHKTLCLQDVAHTSINVRTEVNFKNNNGEDKDVLLTQTEFKNNGEYHTVLFMQNITVDLF